MSKKHLSATFVALAAVAFLSAPVNAVDWDPLVANGSNSAFGWSGGFNNTDKFGDPTVTVDGFLFDNPDDFRADTVTPGATDFARVTVNVLDALGGPAPPISDITIREWGTFGGDVSDVSFQADFIVFRFPPDVPPGVTGTLSLPNDVTVFDVGDGTWYTERTLSVGDLVPSGLPWNVPVHNFQITVTNTVQIDGGAPGGTFIEKHGMHIIIPEPGARSLVLVCGALVLRRSRRRRGLSGNQETGHGGPRPREVPGLHQ